jgi:hypothetical protein
LVLEQFEVRLHEGYRFVRPAVERDGFEGFAFMGRLSTWQKYCSTLKKVNLWGKELE